VSELSDAALAAIEKRASDLALSYADPEKLAVKLAAWVKEHYPERVSNALWITAKGDRDRGILVEIRELKLSDRFRVHAGGLLGKWSAGLALTTELGKYHGATVSVGAGAVVRYADLRDVSPVAVLSVRF